MNILTLITQAFMMTTAPAFAQVPISTETYQLQQLVNTSKQQLKAAKELLEFGKQDTDALDRSSRMLEKLSSGVDRKIDEYQGTAVYEKALLALQSSGLENPKPDAERSQRHFQAFQKQSVQANLSDLSDQEKLAQALRSAEPAFIPKIQTQSQLRNWQSTTRVSSQLTELLSAIQGLREDMSSKGVAKSGLAELIEGADLQNRRQREVMSHGPR